jgi:hypothetical protein
MKKAILLVALVTCSAVVGTFNATAQVNVSVNIGAQPLWGPVGYDHADYYYLPDINAYYYVPRRHFIYREGPKWIFAASLPVAYAHFDLYHGYKVVINEPTPYLRHNVYYKKYHGYSGKKGQPYIRDCHDEKYWVIKGHPEHAKWKVNGHDNGNHNGNGNGNGHGKGKH